MQGRLEPSLSTHPAAPIRGEHWRDEQNCISSSQYIIMHNIAAHTGHMGAQAASNSMEGYSSPDA